MQACLRLRHRYIYTHIYSGLCSIYFWTAVPLTKILHDIQIWYSCLGAYVHFWLRDCFGCKEYCSELRVIHDENYWFGCKENCRELKVTCDRNNGKTVGFFFFSSPPFMLERSIVHGRLPINVYT